MNTMQVIKRALKEAQRKDPSADPEFAEGLANAWKDLEGFEQLLQYLDDPEKHPLSKPACDLLTEVSVIPTSGGGLAPEAEGLMDELRRRSGEYARAWALGRASVFWGTSIILRSATRPPGL